MSQSVTGGRLNRLYLLQIETLVGTTAKVPVPFAVVLGRGLVLPHVVDGAGTFAHVKAGGESAG